LIERYAPTEAKKKLPIISGEWGYSSNTKNISVQTQAVFFARQQIANVMNGIPLSIWYDWKNDGKDPNENEHNFGTVDYDLTPKPAYLAAQTLTRELKGFHITRRIAPANTNDIVLVLNNAGGSTKLVAWTLGEAHMANIEMEESFRKARAVDVTGQVANVTAKQKQLEVPLSFAPIYVTLEK